MKHLKAMLTLLFMAAILSTGLAQNIIIKAGPSFVNMKFKSDMSEEDIDTDIRTGYHIGIALETPISENLFFEPGLLVSTKGWTYKYEDNDYGYYSIKTTMSPVYIDIPLRAKSYFGNGKAKFYGALGPYVGIGVGGKTKYEIKDQFSKETDSEDIEWGSNEDEDLLETLDFGLTAGAGVQIKSFQFELYYDLGLRNISSYKDGDTSIKNKVFGISVGYLFATGKAM